MVAVSLREISIPRFALRRNEAAASLAISPSTFDNWVREGKMPKGYKLGGVTLWDAEAVRTHWHNLVEVEEPQPETDNPYEGIVL